MTDNIAGSNVTAHERVTAGKATTPVYFAVSTRRLILLSICTLGYYAVFYWHYRNWRAVEHQPGWYSINPFWRSIFSVFYCVPLFQRIAETAEAQRIEQRFDAGALAFLYIVLTVQPGMSMIDAIPGWLIFLAWLAAFVPLVFVQRTVNAINAKLAPDAVKNTPFTTRNAATVAAVAGFPALGVVVGLTIYHLSGIDELYEEARVVGEQYYENRVTGRSAGPSLVYAANGSIDDCDFCATDHESLLDSVQLAFGDLVDFEQVDRGFVLTGGRLYVRLVYTVDYAEMDDGEAYEAIILRSASDTSDFAMEVVEVIHVSPADELDFYLEWGRSTCIEWTSDADMCPCAWSGVTRLAECY